MIDIDRKFERWIRYSKGQWTERIYIEGVYPVLRHLPNIKEFFVWMFDKNGYLEKWANELPDKNTRFTEEERERVIYPLIDGIDEKTKNYTDTEKGMIARIMATTMLALNQPEIRQEFMKDFKKYEPFLPFKVVNADYPKDLEILLPNWRNHSNFCDFWVELPPNPIDPPKQENTTLAGLITHKDSERIAKEIKTRFKNIKGKRLKLLLMAMQELNLLPKERIGLKFHTACQNEFNWDVSSYNAMNGYFFNEITDKTDFESIKEIINEIISPK